MGYLFLNLLRLAIDSVRKAIKPLPNSTGLLLDDANTIKDRPRYEYIFGSSGGEAKNWTIHCPPFRYQGSSFWCTGFAGCTVASIFEHVENGSTTLFSPMELFYRADGKLFGNYISKTADAMTYSIVLNSDVPTPQPTKWDYYEWQKYKDLASASVAALERGKVFRVKKQVYVSTDKASLKRALSQSPLIITIGIGKGYWNTPAPATWQYNAYHAVVLVGFDDQDNLIIYDSLTYQKNFDGLHKLASNYPIISATGFVDIPDNWQKVQALSQKAETTFALDHYGKQRSLKLEQETANAITLASKQNPTISDLLGKNFLVYVNAISYGGYSLQDVLNHCTSIRRTGTPIFDFNKPR